MKENVPLDLNLEERRGTWRLNMTSLRYHLSHSSGETHFCKISHKCISRYIHLDPCPQYIFVIPQRISIFLCHTTERASDLNQFSQKVPVDTVTSQSLMEKAAGS